MVDHEFLPLDGTVLFKPGRLRDQRGFFSETFRLDLWSAVIGPINFVQENQSRSYGRGVIRGLHFQRPPHAQGKLVKVVRGSIIDIIVDAREGSATYGEHCSVNLSEENGHQLWVPRGYLHGFCTITEDVEIIYKVDNYYNRAADGAVAFDDPDLGISWPVTREEAVLSDKDMKASRLRDQASPFPAGWDLQRT